MKNLQMSSFKNYIILSSQVFSHFSIIFFFFVVAFYYSIYDSCPSDLQVIMGVFSYTPRPFWKDFNVEENGIMN